MAEVIDGKSVAADVVQKVKALTAELSAKGATRPGLAVVIVGLATAYVVVGVLGFVLIVVSCVAGASALRGPRQTGPISMTSGSADQRNAKPHGLRTKMEDRMRRRFDQN